MNQRKTAEKSVPENSPTKQTTQPSDDNHTGDPDGSGCVAAESFAPAVGEMRLYCADDADSAMEADGTVGSGDTVGGGDTVEVIPAGATENTAFAVVDAPTANWVLRRILEARAYAANVATWAEAETKRARDAEAFFLSRYGDQLATFARDAVAQQNTTFKHDPRKSVKLPAGTLGFRTQPTRFKVEDEATALLWCKLHLPQAVQTSEKVSRTALHEHYTATGELPLGSSLEEEHERFFIK